VFAVLCLLWVFWPIACNEVLTGTRFFTHLYGPAFPATAEAMKEYGDDRWVMARRNLWVATLAAPFQVATILVILWRSSGTRPFQLGLTLHRLRQNFWLGVCGFALLTPAVYGILAGLEVLQKSTEKHDLAWVAEHSDRLPVELAAVIFSAVIAAPVLEELLFRGLLQRWLGTVHWGGAAAAGVAGILALSQCHRPIKAAWDMGDRSALVQASLPVLFVVAMMPGFLLTQYLSRTPNGGAIYGTALLFAAVTPPGHTRFPCLFSVWDSAGWPTGRRA
jgi:membrane protease YdiL (CAAX protease family)